MKATILFFLLVLVGTAYSQNSLNNYKYVIVPEKFEFLREADQYGLNTATKAYLEQKGFVAFVGNNNLPPEVTANKCNALMAEVTQRKGFLVTNLTLQLKDCQGNVVFKSKEGKSREKDFSPAFNLALQDAFTSLNAVEYKYNGTVAGPVQTGTTTTQPAQSSAQPTQTTQPAQPAAQASTQPMSSTSSAPASTTPAPATIEITGTLYAQPITNGFQLVDTSPKKVLVLLKTSTPDYYIAEGGGTHGVVFKKNNEWVFEYYKDNKLVTQKLEIRF